MQNFSTLPLQTLKAVRKVLMSEPDGWLLTYQSAGTGFLTQLSSVQTRRSVYISEIREKLNALIGEEEKDNQNGQNGPVVGAAVRYWVELLVLLLQRALDVYNENPLKRSSTFGNALLAVYTHLAQQYIANTEGRLELATSYFQDLKIKAHSDAENTVRIAVLTNVIAADVSSNPNIIRHAALSGAFDHLPPRIKHHYDLKDGEVKTWGKELASHHEALLPNSILGSESQNSDATITYRHSQFCHPI